MANIIELSQFDASVYQIETTDPVLGGANGIANIQAKQLANRTQYLKKQIDDASVGHNSLAEKLQSIVAADEILSYGSLAVFPLEGEVARIYIALDTNTFYKWDGSEYVSIAAGEGGSVSSEIYNDASAFPETGEVGKMYFDAGTNSFLKWDAISEQYINIAAGEGGVAFELPIASNTVLGGVKVDGTTITINGSGVISASGSGSGSPISTLEVSSNFSAVDNNRYIVNTSGGVVTGTLPMNPDVGTYVEFIDAGETWETNDLTIARNGELINGLNENFICDVSAMKVEMVYVSETYGWQVAVVAVSSTGSGTTVAISNDTSTNIDRYPTFSSSTSGTASTIYTSDTKLKYNPSTGQMEAVAFNATSDARKKTNVEELDKGLTTVLNMNPKSFELIETGNEGIGFIAQELMEVLPEVVSADSEGMLSVNYGAIVAVLVNAIKELKSEIETLKG